MLPSHNEDLVSVVLPVFNGEKYLAKAIDSVLQQTHSNFELIVINDGSTDATQLVLDGYKLHPKIKLISRANKGLVATLNEGIAISNGKYVMRMDADDICLPNRMDTQLKYLIHHNLDLVGSAIKSFGRTFSSVKKYPEHDAAIKFSLLFASCFAHPAIFAKREVLLHHPYDPNFDKIEDYELWTRLAKQGYSMGNCSEVLLLYRVHATQISSANRSYQDDMRIAIAKNYASQYFHPQIDAQILNVLLSRNYTTISKENIAALNSFYSWLKATFPQYKPVIDYQFFLCFLHNFFRREQEVAYLIDTSFLKRNIVKLFNANSAAKRVPAAFYRLLY